MNYTGGITKEEFIRVFGSQNAHKYVNLPKTSTFVPLNMGSPINNKSQYALKTIPYSSPNKRKHINSRTLKAIKEREKNGIDKREDTATLIKQEIIVLSSYYTSLYSLLDNIILYLNNTQILCNVLDKDAFMQLKNKNIHGLMCNEDGIINEYNNKKLITLNNTSNINSYYEKKIAVSVINEEEPCFLNNASLGSLQEINNFKLFKQYKNYKTKARFLLTAKSLHYDLLILNPYYNKGHYLTSSDIDFMKYKGGNRVSKRLIYAYVNICALNSGSKFFDSNLLLDNLTKMDKMDKMEEDGVYAIKFWEKSWENTLIGNNDENLLSMLMKTGYDGIYIDFLNKH
uniref:Glycoside-hydrolase family GH114 TIM-barrel domain-containing protein n=1 Tax=viral metagenome TaxID=1070528 RepID=A0A6C0J3B6_9ZZZZ